jgi:CRISPR-associated protein Cas2
MNAQQRRRYVVTYDIRDDRRLRRVHSTVKGYGWAMQYSVFICDLDKIELTRLRMALGEEINHRVDSIAIIDLGEPSQRGATCFSFLGAAPCLPTQGPVII